MAKFNIDLYCHPVEQSGELHPSDQSARTARNLIGGQRLASDNTLLIKNILESTLLLQITGFGAFSRVLNSLKSETNSLYGPEAKPLLHNRKSEGLNLGSFFQSHKPSKNTEKFTHTALSS